MCVKKTGTSLEVEEGLKTTRQRLLLFAANFPTLRGEEVYLSTSGWSEVRTILRRNVVPTLINGLIFIGILTQYYEKPNWLGKWIVRSKYILRWDDPELRLHLLSTYALYEYVRHVRHWENEGFMTNNWVVVNLIIEKKVNTKSKENPVWKIT